MPKLPDWLIYVMGIAAVVALMFLIDSGQRADAPQALPGQQRAGAFLPPPSIYDAQVLVEVGEVQSGLGTAFAISEDGWWLTARHVVDSCEAVGIIVSPSAAAPALEVLPMDFADLALIKTDFAPVAMALDTSERRLQIGQRAYHVGFPQGRPGEATSRLLGREVLVARGGRFELSEPVLVWSETGRTGGLSGSLHGISGGPVIAENGLVIGVTVAESTRRGRLYTAAPATMRTLLEVHTEVAPRGAPTARLTLDNYGEQADELRRTLAVAQVVCVGPDAPAS